MAVKDLEAMTVDELDALSVGLKREIEALRERRIAIKAVRERKVYREHVMRAVANAGLEGVVVVPETLHMNAEGN